jgi:hypothetical protein
MDLEILKKKISTFRGEGGQVRITDDALFLEILCAWEEWKGPMKEFYRAIGSSKNGMASIIGKAKKMRREGHFPPSDFKEVKVADGLATEGIGQSVPCIGIELCSPDGRVIRFPFVDQLLEFLKKAA